MAAGLLLKIIAVQHPCCLLCVLPCPLSCRPSIATVYAPIAYPPLPLLAFKLPESDGGVRTVYCVVACRIMRHGLHLLL